MNKIEVMSNNFYSKEQCRDICHDAGNRVSRVFD
jgi:hypothetical protein